MKEKTEIVTKIQEIKKLAEDCLKLVAADSPRSTIPSCSGKSKPAGPKGGITLLISKGFFKGKKCAATEVKKELEGIECFYRGDVIQTALNRLSCSSGPLVSFKENGKKVYAERK